ncbi:hypothetical protein [Photobacterium atrarenae]|uniref:Replication protein n=1 Tax=Photobacterium atrarenae TaxID=865757 RepID=A0ABY5GE56_9GAMM|nr:hypothetical protein [Photobacterium atrarenae]UTV27213.1 hypothetical protein NNL38_12855 [Photobacterium atrarenae]
MISDQSLQEIRLEDCEWFISEYKALEENEYRVDALRRLADDTYMNPHRRYCNADLHNLADKLELCNADEIKCRSYACKRCNRLYQISKVNSIVEIIQSEKNQGIHMNYCFITIVQYSCSVQAYDFVNYDIQSDKDRFRNLLKRSGVKGPVLGTIELDFHRSPQVWLPHYHLIAQLSEENKIPINNLRDKVTKLHPNHIAPGVLAKPFMVKRIKSLSGLLSYIYKFSCQEVRYYKGRKGDRRTCKFRLNNLLFCESLCWLDQQNRRSLLFEYNVRPWIKQSEL